MQYASAEWVHDTFLDTYQIKATGDDGSVWWVPTIDSDVPPWPQYLAEGGEITGTPPQAKEPSP